MEVSAHLDNTNSEDLVSDRSKVNVENGDLFQTPKTKYAVENGQRESPEFDSGVAG